MEDGNRKAPEPAPDPEALTKLLELELIQKRASWQQSRQRLGAVRALSFFFLFLVIVGGLFGFWFLFSSGQMSELKANQPGVQDASPTPAPSPR